VAARDAHFIICVGAFHIHFFAKSTTGDHHIFINLVISQPSTSSGLVTTASVKSSIIHGTADINSSSSL
jgi:hypothetical protein